MIRRDHGGGPAWVTTSAIRVWSTFGHVGFTDCGGTGATARRSMTMVAVTGISLEGGFGGDTTGAPGAGPVPVRRRSVNARRMGSYFTTSIEVAIFWPERSS